MKNNESKFKCHVASVISLGKFENTAVYKNKNI